MTDFPGWWQTISTGGALALAVLFLYLFQSGRIRSEKQLTEAVSVYTDVIAAKDKEIQWWREAYTQQMTRADRQEEVNRQNTELAQTALAILNGVHSAAKQVNP